MDFHGDILQISLDCSVTSPVEFQLSLRLKIDLSGQPYVNVACMSGDEH